MKCKDCKHFQVMHFRSIIKDGDKGTCNNKKRIRAYFKQLRIDNPDRDFHYEAPIEERADSQRCKGEFFKEQIK